MSFIESCYFDKILSEAKTEDFESFDIHFGIEQNDDDYKFIESTSFEINVKSLSDYPFKFNPDSYLKTFPFSTKHQNAVNILVKRNDFKNFSSNEILLKASNAIEIFTNKYKIEDDNIFISSDTFKADLILKGCNGETNFFYLRIIECVAIGIDDDGNFHYFDYYDNYGYCQKEEVF